MSSRLQVAALIAPSIGDSNATGVPLEPFQTDTLP